MAREVEPGFYWIYECGPDRSEMFAAEGDSPDWADSDEEVYLPQCAYLLCGEEKSLLLDTLSPASTDHILAELNELLEDGLDYLVVSHPDIPHAGNALAILDAYPDATVVAPEYGDDHELYRLDDALRVGEGDEIDLGGFVAAFHEATFLDAPVSLWMSERSTETLFPIDWFGFPMLSPRCSVSSTSWTHRWTRIDWSNSTAGCCSGTSTSTFRRSTVRSTG